MNVNCPGCNNSYRLDERRIPDSGQRMKCPKCGVSFRVSPTGVTTESSTAPAAPAARASVLPKRPSRSEPIAIPNTESIIPSVLEEVSSLDTSDIDLPGLSSGNDTFGEVDLPAPANVSSGSIDLPTPKDESDFSDIDLSDDDNEADLPAPANAVDLPALSNNDPFGDIDLPAPVDDADLSAPGNNDPFGDIDLPAPVGDADLPAPSNNDPFGDIDLPIPVNDADLPAPSNNDPFGDIALPAPSGAIGLPTPRGASDLPTPSGAIGLPSPRGISDVPTPVINGDFGDINLSLESESPSISSETLSTPLKVDDLTEVPTEHAASNADKSVNRVAASGTTNFGEINLGDNSSDDDEFDAFPVKETKDDPSSKENIGLDLDTDPLENPIEGSMIDDVLPDQAAQQHEDRKPSTKFEGRRKYERQNRVVKVIALIALLFLVIGGGSLYFTPWGIFGMYAIADLLPNAAAKRITRQLASEVDNRLKKDTYFDLIKALDDMTLARKELPQNEDLRIIGVFLNNWYQIRYGENKVHHKEVVKLLGKIDLKKSDSPYAPLAQAADDLNALRIPDLIKRLEKKHDLSNNELAILAETYLLKKDVGKAVAVADKLLKKENSTRAKFLKAKALAASYDVPATIALLKQIVDKNPKHMAAKLLYAQQLSSKNGRDFEAIKALLASVYDQNKKMATNGQKARAHALLGQLYLNDRRYADASSEFNAATSLNAKDEVMLIGQGNLALLNDDLLGASTYFVKARTENPSNLASQLGQIDVMIRQNLLSDAAEVIKELMPNNEKSAKLHYLYGQVELQIKNLEVAEKEFNAAIEISEDYIEPYVALSHLYMRTGRDKKAMAVLDKAGSAVPGSPLVKITLADGHAARGDYASAIFSLNEALKLDSDNIRAHFKIAQMYRKMNALPDAQNALEEVIRINKNYQGLALEQGLLMEKSGKVDAALTAYEQALSTNPNDTSAMIRIGSASLILGKLDKAKEILTKAVSESPRSAEANFFLGEVFRTTDQVAEALTYLKAAQELDNTNPTYHLRYGMALMGIRDMSKAMIHFEQAQLLDPQMAETFVRIGELKLRSGSARDAIKSLDKALNIDPKLTEAYALAGEAFEELSDLRSANHYYSKAISELPNNAHLHFKYALTQMQIKGNRAAIKPLVLATSKAEEQKIKEAWLPEAYYRLGVAQLSLGKKASAVNAFKRYMEIAPETALDRPEVISYLDRLEH